jgi:hypothetical protein
MVICVVPEPAGPVGPGALAAAALLLVTSHGYVDAAEQVERNAQHAEVRDLVGFDVLCRTPGMDSDTAERVCRAALRATADDAARLLRDRADVDWDLALVAIGSAVRVVRAPGKPGALHRRTVRAVAAPTTSAIDVPTAPPTVRAS